MSESTFSARLNASHLLHAAMSAAETDDDRAAVALLFELLKREHDTENITTAEKRQPGVAGILNAGSFDGEFFPHTDSMVSWGMYCMDTTQRRVEVHPEGTERNIRVLESNLDRSEGLVGKLAATLESIEASR